MALGSSPRMRGTLGELVSDCLRMGIIPAHAGNTEIDDLVKSLFGDHPRACGEHWPTISAWPSTRGSSPRMRGTLQRKHALADMAGIIPAHAGNTYGEPHHDLAGGDHPRACGEHESQAWRSCRLEGSSPRMRGTRPTFSHGRAAGGIIPAHAGNTATPPRLLPAPRDHPRACGEHYNGQTKNFRVTGSSPRMRGTLAPLSHMVQDQGIIPAHAGNTS